jgi:deoxyribose-phosphate aldolase
MKELIAEAVKTLNESGIEMPETIPNDPVWAEVKRQAGSAGKMPADRPGLAAYIDHTVLKPETAEKDIVKLCDEARENRFFSVCLNPCWVPLAAEQLKGSGVKVCTVCGFPLGANIIETKVREAQLAVAQGATEVDMVINIGLLKSGELKSVHKDVAAVVEASKGALVKVIIETCLLTNMEKTLACLITKSAGAHYVKTSTGFSTAGATAEDIELMRQAVGPQMGVKASGGVRSLDDVLKMIKAGACRIGTSSGVKILAEMGR